MKNSANCGTHVVNDRYGEYSAEERNLFQHRQYHREEVAEQIDNAEHLDEEAGDRPLDEDEDDAEQEARGACISHTR